MVNLDMIQEIIWNLLLSHCWIRAALKHVIICKISKVIVVLLSNFVHAFFPYLTDSEASNEDSNTATQTEESITESSDSISESSCEVDQSDESSSLCGKQSGFSSEDNLSECDFPVCQGTNVRRKTFEAALLALSIKHNFSKSTRTDIFKFLKTFLPKPNLPSSNYVFEKNLVDSMSIHYSKCELCVNCSTATSDGKCTNRHCTHFNRKLNDHDIGICYFIPIKDQLERILTGIQKFINIS